MTVDVGENITSILLALIAGIPAIIAAFYAYRAQARIGKTHDLVNGRMDELLDMTRANATAEGVTQGVAEALTDSTTIERISLDKS